MTNAIRLLAAGASLLAGSTAEAQVGFTLAGRIGAAIPYGDSYRTSTGGSVPVAGSTTATIPFQLDVGVTLARRYFVGAYGQYRIGLLKSGACAEGLSCSENGVRVGGEFIYSFATSRSGIGAWIGIASGWEWATSRATLAGTAAAVTFSGWEFAQLQLGFDAWISQAFRVGFYISGSVGQFSRVALSDGTGTENVSLDGKALHGWFEMGFKTTFDL
jgi:hypothetical protein